MLRIGPKYVSKDRATNADAKMQHLELVNGMLTSHDVPNVEMLVGTDKKAQVLMFQPRGDSCQPCNLLELYDALVNELEMLVALHKAGWMRRWIQWSSIHSDSELISGPCGLCRTLTLLLQVRSRVRLFVLLDGQRIHRR